MTGASARGHLDRVTARELEAAAERLGPVLAAQGRAGISINELHEAMRVRHSFTGTRTDLITAIQLAKQAGTATHHTNGRLYAPQHAPEGTDT